LQQNVRRDILRASEAFLLFEKFELEPEVLPQVKIILESHEKAAIRFFNDLFVGPPTMSDAGVCSHHLIEHNFKASQLKTEVETLDAFINLLRAFHIACNISIRQVAASLPPFTSQKDSAWTNWIGRLTEILKAAKLPHSLGKDVGKIEQSPFVLFIWEVQKCLPETSRRHCRSQAALAEAIGEALSRKHRGK
jgi:hypothetical protein